MAKMENADNTECWQRGATGTPMHRWGGHHMVGPLGKLSVISNTVQHTLTVGASNLLVGIYPKEKKKSMSIQESGREDFSCFTHNRPKLQTAPMALDWWMGRQAAVWSVTEWKEVPAHATTWVGLKGATLKEASLRPPLYDSAYITVLERQNYSDGERISSCQGLWVRTGRDGKKVWGKATIWIRTAAVVTRIRTCAQTQGCTLQKVNFILY